MSTPFTIEIEEGVPYTCEVLYQDDDGEILPIPAGSTAKLQARAAPEAGSPVLWELTHVAGLTINEAGGSVAVKVSVAYGQATPVSGTVYDLFLYPPAADEVKLLWGPITKRRQVTRP